MTKGGADYCFECIGLASVMNDAFKSCRKVQTNWPVYTSTKLKLYQLNYTRKKKIYLTSINSFETNFTLLSFLLAIKGWGKTIIIGVEMHGAPVCLESYEILRGKCVIGSLFGGIKTKTDIPILADKYLNKVIFFIPCFKMLCFRL